MIRVKFWVLVITLMTSGDLQSVKRSCVRARAEHQKDVLNRLRRIEGQVRGLVEMISNGRPCEEVALQMSAARKAMDKTFYRMMTCSVIEAVCDSKTEAQRLVEVERSARLLEKFG